jgi:hypothetical protein
MSVNEPLAYKVDALMSGYLSEGCPCRFPRFRASCARDTSKKAGGTFVADDQGMLIAVFEERAPLTSRVALGPNDSPMPGMYAADCTVCGSRVERSSVEFGPGGWADFLVIRRGPSLTELGAPIEAGRVLRARPFRPAGPGMEGLGKASAAFPLVYDEEWIAWLQARA